MSHRRTDLTATKLRIETLNDSLRIMTAIDPAAAGNVVVVIKDNTDVAGLPTGHGADPWFARQAEQDAQIVARLRRAGAAIVGKSNMFEFAYGAAHPTRGDTRNPRDHERSAGGSSGGSAAAVAAGIADGAFGTDTGGSIRLPAAYCGVVGFKPTFSNVPLQGVQALSPTLDHGGPLANDVATTSMLYNWMTGDKLVAPCIRRMTFVVLDDYFLHATVQTPVQLAIETALARLITAGHVISHLRTGLLSPPMTVVEAGILVMAPEAAIALEAFERAAPERLTDATRAQIAEGFAIPAVWHLRALAFRQKLASEFHAALEGADALILPTAPTVAPGNAAEVGSNDDLAQMLCTIPFNMTGQPAITLPLRCEPGTLHAGLQLVGRFGEDAALLCVAKVVEAALSEPA